MWFDKLGQGTKYIDIMNNDAILGQKRKIEQESNDSQESCADSQGTESEKQQVSQRFGKLKMGDPILLYVIVFGNVPGEEEDVQRMKIGCFISQKKAGDHKCNNTPLALLYRKHVQGNCAIGKARCTMLKQIYRIFNFRGKLKVIAVPFIEGSHCPQSKEQLLVVAKCLKKMHDNGLVHGDIRLLNIVFTEKPEDSQLIDSDFRG
jgi:hypothetical protein